MIGHVQGGWESIWIAYFLSWAGIAMFGASLVPAGPLRLAYRELIVGAMSLFVGVTLAASATSTGSPFIDRTLLTIVTIGGGLSLLAHFGLQFAQHRRKEH
jgi:hypothetical protein